MIYFLLVCLSTLVCGYSEPKGIDSHGIWYGDGIEHMYNHDKPLAKGLVQFFEKEHPDRVVDFGCGLGDYVKELKKHHISCEGYDGNPDIFNLSGGVVNVLDLSQQFDLQSRYDWVVCLEVGEHIPQQFEATLIENLARHAKKGIVLSWAVLGQPGYGHVNNRDNAYIKQLMLRYGFYDDLESEKFLRNASTFPWFKNTIMVFRRK